METRSDEYVEKRLERIISDLGLYHGIDSASFKILLDAFNERKSLRDLRDSCEAAKLLNADGTLRKVLGQLPITADGCVLGDWAMVWWRNPFANNEVSCEMTASLHNLHAATEQGTHRTQHHAEQPARKLYSSRSAVI